MNQLLADPQFTHSVTGIYIVDGKTGKPVFEMNSEAGLAPASCLKLITSISALDMMGPAFRYETTVGLLQSKDSLRLVVNASGDPAFGSPRWKSTGMKATLDAILHALKAKGITQLACDIVFRGKNFPYPPVPDGWVWEDIGNYYGAGAWSFNWNENKYDWILSSGLKKGDATRLKYFSPSVAGLSAVNDIITGEKGSGDNAYVYAAPYVNQYYATGTIPPQQDEFAISASMHEPAFFFIQQLKEILNSGGIRIAGGHNPAFEDHPINRENIPVICTFASPSLDSMNDWFLKKSINLFGEAFVKTIALQKCNVGSTDSGVVYIRNFWKERGIENSALKIIDGSGLSPANRVTAKALVQVLQYAQKRPWFSSFYEDLPAMNGIKMKDGYISGVRSYAGFIKNNESKEYIFAFIVNNFDGNPGAVREKMWKILNLLK